MPATKPTPPRVAILDPLPGMRLGLAVMLERGGYAVVLHAAGSQEMITALEGGTEVDLVLVDVRPPDADGCALLSWLRTERPAVRALAYGLPADDGAVVRAYREGARAMLPKDMDEAQLLRALEAVLAVGVFHTEHTQRVLLENPDGQSAEERRRSKLEAQMSPRELEVLLLVCRADCPSYARIGKELEIAKRTVECHVDELFDLFGVKNKTALALSAIRVGLVRA